MHSKILLAASIVKFLEQESKSLSGDKQEGLQDSDLVNCPKLSLDTSTSSPASASSPYPSTTTPPQLNTNRITPQSREKAEHYKTEGNDHISARRYAEAADSYTHAIELDPENAVYYGNRAAAFLGQQDYGSAIEDCLAAISLNSQYGKAYSRLGSAYFELGNADKAIEAYKKATELEPDNVSFHSGLDKAQKLKRQKDSPSNPTSTATPPSNNNAPRGSPFGGAAGGLDFSSMLNNPDIMSAASEMMKNPEMLKNMMNSPQMAAMMQGMMGGGSGSGSRRNPPPADEEDE